MRQISLATLYNGIKLLLSWTEIFTWKILHDTVLFIVFMEIISRHSHVTESSHFGDLWISSLLFAGDVGLLASSGGCLQHSLERFPAEYEAARTRITTPRWRPWFLAEKGGVPTLFRDELLPQVQGFKYLRVLWRPSEVREKWSGKLTDRLGPLLKRCGGCIGSLW